VVVHGGVRASVSVGPNGGVYLQTFRRSSQYSFRMEGLERRRFCLGDCKEPSIYRGG